MKSILVIIDGLGDEPIPELNGRTPLESAFTPNLDRLVRDGLAGRITTTFKGFPIESAVCIMGLLGYEPERFYPSGRASFEAMAVGIPVRHGDLLLRCNTVSIDRERRTLRDFTAGPITDSAAQALLARVELPGSNWELHPGRSYRNILVIRDAGVEARDLMCREPHMNIGQPVAETFCVARTHKAQAVAERINAFLMDTERQIDDMEFPEPCAANMLWAWSPSSKPVWPPFFQRSGVRAALVCGAQFLQGIALAAAIPFAVIPGATGNTDTDYDAKAEHTMRYLREHDFVLAHINAPDEAAHRLDYSAKIEAIENIDRMIIGPVLEDGVNAFASAFRIAVCGDHTTRSRDGKHTDDPGPLAVFGGGIPPSNVRSFSERSCAGFPAWPSLTFLKHVLWAA